MKDITLNRAALQQIQYVADKNAQKAKLDRFEMHTWCMLANAANHADAMLARKEIEKEKNNGKCV